MPGAKRCESSGQIAAAADQARVIGVEDNQIGAEARAPAGQPAAGGPGAAREGGAPKGRARNAAVLRSPPRPGADGRGAGHARAACSSAAASVAVLLSEPIPNRPPAAKSVASGKMPSPRSASVRRAQADHRLPLGHHVDLRLGQMGAMDQAPALVDRRRARRAVPAAGGRTGRGSRGPPWAARPGGYGSAAIRVGTRAAATAAVIAVVGTARTEWSARPSWRSGSSAKSRSQLVR